MNTASAKNVVEFSKVMSRDANGRVKTVLVPGHDAKQYYVILHRNGGIMEVECALQTPNGPIGCPGNKGGVCYHSLAAVAKAAQENHSQVAFLTTKRDARNVANLHGKHDSRVFMVKSLDSKRVAFGVTWSAK